MKLTTPLYRVKGLGSAKDGTHHWWMQRLTAIALIPLTLWFVFSILSVMPANYAEATEWLRSPVNTSLLIVWIGALFFHAKLGLQVVIEDYLHHKPTRTASLILVYLGCWVLGIACVVAILKVSFGA